METKKQFPGFWQAVLLFIGVLICTIAVMIPVVIFQVATKIDLIESPLVQGYIQIGSIFVVLVVGFLFTSAPIEKVFPFRPFDLRLLIPMTLAAVGIGFLLSEFDNLLHSLFPGPRWLEADLHEMVTGASGLLSAFFLLCIVAPVTEELLMRGLVLNGFLTRYRVRNALLLSALLFALLHINLWQMPGAFLWGIIWGWWRVETRSLWPCLFGHAVANGFPIVLLGVLKLEIPGMIPRPDGLVEFQPLWLDAFAVVLAIAGLWWLKSAFSAGRRSKEATTVLEPRQSESEDSDLQSDQPT